MISLKHMSLCHGKEKMKRVYGLHFQQKPKLMVVLFVKNLRLARAVQLSGKMLLGHHQAIYGQNINAQKNCILKLMRKFALHRHLKAFLTNAVKLKREFHVANN